MNIAVIGAVCRIGYGGCLALLGMNVICMDIDEDKINKLKMELFRYRPGLEYY